MQVGIQLLAPEGFGPLCKGHTYHFLRSDSNLGRVLLVQFSGWDMDRPNANLVAIQQAEFEQGLESNHIIPSEHQHSLPPWLTKAEGINFELVDLERVHAKQSHKGRIERRLSYIGEALKDAFAILSADDPERALNSYARNCRPVQHENRFRLWFLVYLCFGQNSWALLPPYCRIGQWPRSEHPETKFGAPSLAYGRHYGHPCSQAMIEMMKVGYLKFSDLGRPLIEIYRKTMTYIFGCTSLKGLSGATLYTHPLGAPFPSYEQFRYQIHKYFGLSEVQKSLYGRVRHRASLAPSKGRFTQEVANLLERVEADGYYTIEKPRGYVEGSALPSLCVVIGRDVLSGMKTGIGFAFGKERSSAYRMMLFSMAVGKRFFCSLFGIAIDDNEWPCQGLSPYFRIDRGPGAKSDLIKKFEQRVPIKDIVPSSAGQSKATVESSHPKDIRIEGEPTYIHSDLTPIQLARREIYSVLRFIHTADMSDRISPDRDMLDVLPTPIGLWTHYEGLLRTDAQPMTVVDAVRTFLTPTTFTVKHDGVWLRRQRYDSPELRAAGILDKVARGHSIKIQGFTLDLCVRHVWVEVDNRLLMLGAQKITRAEDEDLYISVAELDQWEEHRRVVDSAFRVHQNAVDSDYMRRFTEDTGKEWGAGKRKSGRPRKDATNRQETLEACQATAHQRAA